MSVETIYIGKNAENIELSASMDVITYVALTVDDVVAYTAGTYTVDSAMLTFECPYATQEMANNILEQLTGYKYQPLMVTGVLLDPSFELGDAMTAAGHYTGMFKQRMTFYGSSIVSDVSAEADEEFQHEYTYRGDKRKYATYNSLKNGTAEVSGACITQGSICGSGSGGTSGSSSGSKIKTNQILAGSIGIDDVDFGDTLSDVEAQGQTLKELEKSLSGLADGGFETVRTQNIWFGNGWFHVATSGSIPSYGFPVYWTSGY